MASKLRQGTAVDIKMGPFLDETDGKTPETTLTITQPDIRLAKNGSNWAQKSAAQTLSHEENGWYEVALSATDTDTLGILIVAIHESGALPVWREFEVVAAGFFDAPSGLVAGVVAGGASTTSLPTSSLTPAAAVADQYKGRIVIFTQDTVTANLRGQATDIIASTAGGTLTVTALTTAPAAGEKFVIV